MLFHTIDLLIVKNGDSFIFLFIHLMDESSLILWGYNYFLSFSSPFKMLLLLFLKMIEILLNSFYPRDVQLSSWAAKAANWKQWIKNWSNGITEKSVRVSWGLVIQKKTIIINIVCRFVRLVWRVYCECGVCGHVYENVLKQHLLSSDI